MEDLRSMKQWIDDYEKLARVSPVINCSYFLYDACAWRAHPRAYILIGFILASCKSDFLLIRMLNEFLNIVKIWTSPFKFAEFYLITS